NSVPKSANCGPTRAPAILTMMSGGQRYESEGEGLRLVIEKRPDHFQVFVYDPAECEVLYTCEQMSLDAPEFAAVNFAATARFGPGHDLKPPIISAMFVGGRPIE